MAYIGQQLGFGRQEKYVFTAVGGETLVNTSDDNRNILYSVGQVDVFVNGIKLVVDEDYTASTGDSITFLEALDPEDSVEVVAFEVASSVKPYSFLAEKRYVFTASGGETSVTTADNNQSVFYQPNFVEVYQNGVRLVRGSDYTATTGTSIDGLTALTTGDVIEVVAVPIVEVPDTVSSSVGGTFAGPVDFGGSVSPTQDVTFDLGTPSLRWRDLYLSGSSITLGDAEISSDSDGVNLSDGAGTPVRVKASTFDLDDGSGTLSRLKRNAEGKLSVATVDSGGNESGVSEVASFDSGGKIPAENIPNIDVNTVNVPDSNYWRKKVPISGSGLGIDSIVTDADSNVYVVASGNSDDDDYGVFSYDKYGALRWQTTNFLSVTGAYTRENADASLSPDASHVYVSMAGGSSNTSGVLFKMDTSTGGVVWSKSFENSAPIKIPLGVDSNENIFVANVEPTTPNSPDDNIVKFDSSGNEVDSFHIVNSSSQVLTRIEYLEVSSTNNIYVLDINFPNVLVKVNSSFVKQYEINPSNGLNGLVVDSNDNVYIVLNSSPNKLEKYDSSGSLVWSYTSPDPFGAFISNAVSLDENEDVYFVGLGLHKVDKSGNEVFYVDQNNNLAGTPISISKTGNYVYCKDFNLYVRRFKKDGSFSYNFNSEDLELGAYVSSLNTDAETFNNRAPDDFADAIHTHDVDAISFPGNTIGWSVDLPSGTPKKVVGDAESQTSFVLITDGSVYKFDKFGRLAWSKTDVSFVDIDVGFDSNSNVTITAVTSSDIYVLNAEDGTVASSRAPSAGTGNILCVVASKRSFPILTYVGFDSGDILSEQDFGGGSITTNTTNIGIPVNVLGVSNSTELIAPYSDGAGGLGLQSFPSDLSFSYGNVVVGSSPAGEVVSISKSDFFEVYAGFADNKTRLYSDYFNFFESFVYEGNPGPITGTHISNVGSSTTYYSSSSSSNNGLNQVDGSGNELREYFGGIASSFVSGNLVLVVPGSQIQRLIPVENSINFTTSYNLTSKDEEVKGYIEGIGVDGVYTPDNVVGVIPTPYAGASIGGAIIERGSNANGEYVKFSDGTLICTFRSSTELTTSNLQTEVYFAPEPTFTFPEPFVSTPFISSATLESNSISWGMVTNNTSSTSVQMRLLGSRNIARGFLGYIAIGRWY